MWLVSSGALLTPCGLYCNCISEAEAYKLGCCESLGFVAVYSSAQTAHSSPADVPAPLLVCRIDEPSTQVSSRSLYIDKAIMHASLLCITVPPTLKTNGVSEYFSPHFCTLLRGGCGLQYGGSGLISVGNESQLKL